MDIKALQWELAAFVVDRGLDPLHTPKNLSMALAAEAGTLLALFKWLADEGLATPAQRSDAADALADSVLHAIHLADRLGIDLDEAIRRKLARNAEKYPPAPVDAPAPVSAPAPAAPPSPAFAPAPAVASAPPPPPAAPERRASTPERRVVPDRRVAPERKFEPERRVGSERRTDRRGSGSRGPASVMPDLQTRFEPPRPAAPPPPVQEAPRAAAPPPPPAARYEPPPPPPPPPPEPEVDPYAWLDPDEARRFVEALTKQVTRARSDDPLARELHDELTTLKRSLYADNPKRAWLAGSLKSIRRILDEARSHSVGAELRAREYLAEVDRILKE
jgi:NTP pyrophosphatase (non-canonical NTP hydrolase)